MSDRRSDQDLQNVASMGNLCYYHHEWACECKACDRREGPVRWNSLRMRTHLWTSSKMVALRTDTKVLLLEIMMPQNRTSSRLSPDRAAKSSRLSPREKMLHPDTISVVV